VFFLDLDLDLLASQLVNIHCDLFFWFTSKHKDKREQPLPTYAREYIKERRKNRQHESRKQESKKENKKVRRVVGKISKVSKVSK
jgi:hypothetical protein